MITFKISFLLSLPMFIKKANAKKKQDLKSREKMKSSKDDNNVGKKIKNVTESESFDIQASSEQLNIEFNATNILSAVHIQYDLISYRCKYDLDVICWGPIAKIITNDGNILVFTVIKDDTIWIPICIEHYLESFSIKEIKAFHNQIIDFHITNILQKAPGVFKMESIVIRKDEIINEGQQSFKNRTVFKYVIGNISAGLDSAAASRLSLEHYIKNLIHKCINFPKNETISWLNDDSNNFEIFYNVLEKFYSGEHIKVCELIYPCTKFQADVSAKSKKKNKDKLDQKNKKVEKKKVRDDAETKDRITISVPGEIFFTEFSVGTFHVASKGNFVNDAFVFVSAQNLLSRTQKLSLNPIVVKLFKIENFPAKELRKLGFESIFASYNIPDVLKCATKVKPLSEIIHFNEAHMHFMDCIPKMKLIERIETNRFFVEIYGNKTKKEGSSHSGMFGENLEDFKISRIGPAFEHFIEHVENNLPVLLAVSVFDVSSIVANIWDFREIGQCHAPNLNLYSVADYHGFQYTDTKNVNDINMKVGPVKKKTICESTFLELGTTVSVEVYLMAPQAPSLVYHHVPNTFKRLFFTTDNQHFAEMIYNQIFHYNNVIFNDVETHHHNSVEMNKLDILTGFVLDNGNNYFFYIEGTSTGFILNIWHMIQESCPLMNSRSGFKQFSEIGIRLTKGKVFFNTDNAFEARLYLPFIAIGLYVIALKIPLQHILDIPSVYCKNKLPNPCLNALSKLSLLFDSNYYKQILQQNLLPLPQELVSLNLEWGVPIRWKEIVDY